MLTNDQIVILVFIFGVPLLMIMRTWYVKYKIDQEMKILDAEFRKKRNEMIDRLNEQRKERMK